jgi:hypothetical protein
VTEIAAKPKAGTMPKGTYDALIGDVSTLRRKEDRQHMLRVIVRTVGQGRDGIVWQSLAEGDRDDPFDLTDTQRRSVMRFAGRLGIDLHGVPSRLPMALAAMRGDGVVVQARVSQTKVGQRVTLTASTLPVVSNAGPIAQQVIDDTEAAAKAAHEAHEKVMQGLRAVRLGLAAAAEGCHDLHRSEGWRALGCETLAEYLAAPEVTLSRPKFYALSEIWARYVEAGGIDPSLLGGADRTKLEVPLPALGQGLVTAEQAVADATSMAREDLRARYDEILGKVVADDPDGGPSRRRDPREATPDMVDRAVRAGQVWYRERGQPESEDGWRELFRVVIDAALSDAVEVVG